MVEIAALKLALLRHGPTDWNDAGPRPGPYRHSLERGRIWREWRRLRRPFAFHGARFRQPDAARAPDRRGIGPDRSDSGCAADGAELGTLGRADAAQKYWRETAPDAFVQAGA